ncbi:spermatogenesis-associated protein 31D3-like [Perognathus longimembris pacificus]|uniref:spermatogenesis-associated protein 31D3-like n=1 Tax=Perognathus longimembris pacificus TaxID=214514 RepID=UPI0020184374|nr:spermatogenesis-associated protein 31D3-like [Perognathus longimembris pacificus]
MVQQCDSVDREHYWPGKPVVTDEPLHFQSPVAAGSHKIQTMENGRRSHREEAEEGRKLLSILKSPLNLPHDTTSFRQLLCPDPFCEVCNRTTAEVSHLLSQAYLKEVTCALPLLASTAPMKKSSSPTTALSAVPPQQPIQAPTPELSSSTFSVLSPNQDTPLKDLNSLPSLDGSGPSEPISPLDIKFPVDPSPAEQLAIIPPPLAHHTQGRELVLQQNSPLSTVDSPDRLSTYDPTTRGVKSSSLAMSGFSCRQPIVNNTVPSNLVECEAKQDFLDLHSSEAPTGGVTATYYVEPCNLSFVRLDVLEFLETQIKKKEGFLMWKEKENKTASFSKQDMLLNSVGKVLESVAEQQDLTVSLPFGISKGKQGELHKYMQAPVPHPYEDHSQEKSSTKHFWGLPSLHSESLSPTAPALGDCNLKLVCFNIISNVSTAHESPIISNPKPLPLSEIQSQVLPETLCQDLLGAQTQLQSPLLVLPPSLIPQVRTCGVCFYGPQSEAQLLIPSETHLLENNILKKKQEIVWGLPSVVQRSQDDFCPPAPKLPLVRQYSKANVTISILLGDFPLTSELRQKLEHHLRKRLIQHHWGLPRRIQESLSLISPRIEMPQSSESKSSQGLSEISSVKREGSKNPNFESSQPENSDEKSSEIPLLEEEVGKKQGHSAETGSTDDLSSDSEGVSHSSSGSDSESSPESSTGSVSRNNLSTSLSQKQLKDALERHWDKKFAEISEGHTPGSHHSNNMHLSTHEKSPSQMKQRALEPLMGRENSLNTPHDISFHDSCKQNILADRIKFFHMKMMHGLLQKVQESIEIANEKESPSQACTNFKLPSPSISGVDSKFSVSQPFRENSHSDEKIRTTNSPFIMDCPDLAASSVSREGQGSQRQSLPNMNHEYVDLHKMKDRNCHLLCQTQSITNKASLEQPVASTSHSPKLHTSPAEALSEPLGKRKISDKSVKQPQEKSERLRHNSMSTTGKSREISKMEDLCYLKSQASTTLKISKCKSSLVTHTDTSKVDFKADTLTTQSPLMGTSGLHNPELSDLKCQLFDELKLKLESKRTGKAQGLQDDLPLRSDNLLTPNSGVSSVDMAASHGLYARLDKTKVSREQGQEPLLPCGNKGVSPSAPKSGELGKGDAALPASQPRKRSHDPQDKTLKNMAGSKSSHLLSQKGQPPCENRLRNHVKQFFQWLSMVKNGKGQESSLGKGSFPRSSMQARSLGKGRAAFPGNTENQKVTKNTGKVPVEKQGQRHGVDVTCPQGPPLSPMKSGKTQQNLQTKTDCIQGQNLSYKASCSGVLYVKSRMQEAACPGQNYLEKNRQGTAWHGKPTKVVLFADHRHPTATAHMEPVLHSRPICTHQVHQVPLAAPIIPNGGVLENVSLLKERIFIIPRDKSFLSQNNSFLFPQ